MQLVMHIQGGAPTWDGWSQESLQDWWPFIKIAIPSRAAMDQPAVLSVF